jgi:hypothetical protein
VEARQGCGGAGVPKSRSAVLASRSATAADGGVPVGAVGLARCAEHGGGATAEHREKQQCALLVLVLVLLATAQCSLHRAGRAAAAPGAHSNGHRGSLASGADPDPVT